MKLNHENYKNAFKQIQASKELDEKIVQIYNGKHTKHKFYKRLIRVATIGLLLLLTTVSTVTIAGNISINKIFKNYFKQPITDEYTNNNSSQLDDTQIITKELNNDNEFLLNSSIVLNETITGNGLNIFIRGIVGDNQAVYIAFDVKTQDGSPFSKEQEDIVTNYSFDKVYLQIDNQTTVQYCSTTRIDDGKTIGKATFLIDELLFGYSFDDIKGHNLTITISDMKKRNDSIDFWDMKEDLMSLLSKFNPIEKEDYLHWSYGSSSIEGFNQFKELKEKSIKKEITNEEYMDTINKMKDEDILYETYVLKKTSEPVLICSKYPDLKINNMGFIEDALYINFDLNGELSYQELSNKSLLLINKNTGEMLNIKGVQQIAIPKDAAIIKTFADPKQADYMDSDEISIRYVFHGISKIEQLKDAVFALGGIGSTEIIYEGEWKFNFVLDYKNTTTSFEPYDSYIFNYIKVNQIELSPISVKFIFESADNVNTDLYRSNLWVKLKDGTKIAITNSSWNYDSNNQNISCSALLPYVIETNKIQSFIIEDVEINICE